MYPKVLSLEFADFGEFIRQFRYFARGADNSIILACLYALAAQVAVKVIYHMDELLLTLYAVMRTDIGTLFASLAKLRIDVNRFLAEADAAVLLDVSLVYRLEFFHSCQSRYSGLLSQ
jgi:hypothetical protein